MLIRMIVFAAAIVALAGAIYYSQQQTANRMVSGVIEADEIRLGSRVGGRVAIVHIREGDVVEPGQTLIEFEPYDLLEREQQALAELAMREAELERLQNGLRPEEIQQAEARVAQIRAQLELLENGPRPEEIQAAQERLSAAEAELQLAQREYDRRAKLIQTEAISKAELDAAREQFEAARAKREIARNELAILEQGTRPEELAQIRARLKEAELALELARQGNRIEDIRRAQAARDAARSALQAIRIQKQELKITAPTAGRIDALDLHPGDLVAAGAPAATLLTTDRLWFRTYIPQRWMDLKEGQTVSVVIDNFPDQTFPGTVSFVARQAEFTPSNVQTSDERAKQVYRSRLELSDPEGRLRPGMTGNLFLEPVAGDAE